MTYELVFKVVGWEMVYSLAIIALFFFPATSTTTRIALHILFLKVIQLNCSHGVTSTSIGRVGGEPFGIKIIERIRKLVSKLFSEVE